MRFLTNFVRREKRDIGSSIYHSICKIYGNKSKLMNINISKEDILVEELIKILEAEKAKYVAERNAVQGENIDRIVAERLEEVKAEIREKVIAEHNSKFAEVDLEVKALERLIANKIAEFEAQKLAEVNAEIEQESVEG